MATSDLALPDADAEGIEKVLESMEDAGSYQHLLAYDVRSR
jgi:hypothetical protein